MNSYHYELLQELQKRLGSLATPEYLAELDKYHKFFETITPSMGPMDLYKCMRECSIYKLYDEPHIYESMNASVILDGILGKHLQDLLTLVSLYQLSPGPFESVLEEHIRKAIQIFPRNSPCLDAYTTELDRLVRIVTKPIESAAPGPSTLQASDFVEPEINPQATEYEVAYKLLQSFHSCVKNPSDFTCENFRVFLFTFGIYGNPKYSAVLMPTFVEVSNLLEHFYQVNDICDIIHPSTFDDF